jgi:uncharacterized protein YjbI with pentapeptide repeats
MDHSAIDISGARTRDFDLEGSQLAGLDAPLAETDGNLNFNGCRCSGQVVLTGAHITGALLARDGFWLAGSARPAVRQGCRPGRYH